jgi:hypothetical protein
MVKWLFVSLLAVAACGQQDNLVLGGTDSFNGSPALVFQEVRSAIHNTVTLKDPTTGQLLGTANAVVVSTRADLCGALAAKADYLRNPTDEFVALVLITPTDKLGTFYPGNDSRELLQYTELLGAAGGGPTNAVMNVFNGNGYITISQLDQDGSGAFYLFFGGSPDGLAHLYQGKFKSKKCDALAAALLP